MTAVSAQARWARSLGVSIGILLLSAVVAASSSSFIAARFPDRPRPEDLMFRTLPYLEWTQHLTDIALYMAIGLLAWYAFKGRVKEIPRMIALFGIMELVRAFIIPLTPLAGPRGNGALYGLVPIVQNGEFPSGHAACVMLAYLLVDPEEAPGLRRVMLVLLVIECGSLLLSHGHYSIDIVGGLLLSYFVYHAYMGGRVFNWLKPLIEIDLEPERG